VQGWRAEMEDTHFVDMHMTKKQSIFAVFDGHGGSDVANYARDNFVNFQMKKELI
jgi:serine/threonine protein phosphatase PrpC